MLKLRDLSQEEAESLESMCTKFKDQYNCTSDSSLTHLRSSLTDWRVESLFKYLHVSTFSSIEINDEIIGFACLNMTRKQPRVGTIRHFCIFEPYRSKGHGAQAMELIHLWFTEKGCGYVRFFSDKKSTSFYEKLGIKWLGISKTNLPFTLYPIKHKLFKVNTNLVYNDYEDTLRRLPSSVLMSRTERLKSLNYDINQIMASTSHSLQNFGD